MLTGLFLVFLYWLFDFIHNISYFDRHNANYYQIIQYYIFQSPFFLYQYLPIVTFSAVVITMMSFAASNEITAIRSAGISPLSLSIPFVTLGLILGIFAFIMSEWIIPYSSERSHQIMKVGMEGLDPEMIRNDSFWSKNGKQIINFKKYDSQNQTLMGVRVIDLDDNFRPIRVLGAALGKKTSSSWLLKDLKIQSFSPDGKLLDSTEKESLYYFLPIDLDSIKADHRIPEEMKLIQLSELIHMGKRQGVSVFPYEFAWHAKLAFPFTLILLSLLGLRFGYKNERSLETIRSIFVALALSVGYWVVFSGSKTLSLVGSITPALAAWSGNLLLVVFIGFQFYELNKNNL